ncbi:MAG: hypothetical protein RI963_494 [Planctomycetota bacterium]|jgi:hypothetical protein
MSHGVPGERAIPPRGQGIEIILVPTVSAVGSTKGDPISPSHLNVDN